MIMRTIVALIFLLSMSTANAALLKYDFSYTLISGDILAGSMLGTLQGDNDTIIVSSALDFVTFNGVDGPTLAYTDSSSNFFTASGLPSTVTVSGSFMDLIVCATSICLDGFLFEGSGGTSRFSSGSNFGAVNESFIPSAWNIQVNHVSAPATVTLFALGLIGIASRRFKIK